MGWLDRLRGVSTPAAIPVEDCVWRDGDARLAGLRARLDTLPRRSALVVTRDRHAFDAMATALSALGVRGGDGRLDARDALEALRQAGTLALLEAARLEAGTATPSASPPQDIVVHVIAHAMRRSDDERLFAAIRRWHRGRVVVHSALDDPLLRPHAEKIEPLLRRLGVDADQPIESPLIAQALRRAQRD